MQAKKKKQFMYRGKPIYRIGNTIYYGDLSEKYIMKLDILETKTVKDIEAATNVRINIIENTGDLGSGTVVRKSDRPDLYTALDTGEWWLKMALNQA